MDIMKKQVLSELISVVILSFNRKEEVLNTIKKVNDVDYSNKEIIIVDNASNDGTTKEIKQNYPTIKIISLKNNIGVSGWNYGYNEAKGRFVLLLDDDAYPEKSSFKKCIDVFEKDKIVACIAFCIFNLKGEYGHSGKWQPPEGIEETYWPVFNGCCAMFDKYKIITNELIPKEIFLYLHEIPIAANLNTLGYKIFFSKSITGFHNFKEYRPINDSYLFKNSLIFLKSYSPFPFNYYYIIQLILFFFTRAIRNKWFILYLTYLVKAKKIKYVKKVGLSYFYEIRKLQLFYIPFHHKIKKYFH